MFLINLLGLYLILSEDHNGCCFSVWQPPSPNITPLTAACGKQSLLVSWFMNHGDIAGGKTEIQISRTDSYTIIYSENVSAPSADSDRYTWKWTSDVPLECVDHSVRIRHFYNQSILSPWSNWTTNPGVKLEEKKKIYPFDNWLEEGTRAIFCCVPPPGMYITNMTFNAMSYPLISIGARVKAIAVDKLTIPTSKLLIIGCSSTPGNSKYSLNFIIFPPQKPRNLSCATTNMATVKCTWNTDRNPPRGHTQTLHIENSGQAPINCEELPCTFPAIPLLKEYNISVVVKNCVGEERVSYIFNISDRVFPVVQWERFSPGVTNATVSWIVQGNLSHLNLLCQVTTDPHSKSEQLSCKSVNGLCTVKLENLLPSTQYTIMVRCSVNGRLWGKWTLPKSFTTYPLVTFNLWRKIKQLSDQNSRQVTLLWTTHVSGSATTVTIRNYRVHWLEEGQKIVGRKESEQTQTEVSIGLRQCNFTVEAVLHRNLSIPAHIIIPKVDNRKDMLVEKQLSSSISSGFNISWAEQVTATCGYTVEWCILGKADLCALQWRHLPKGENALFIPGNFTAGHRYTFNIYECTENGHRQLEIQSGYSQELESVQSPSLSEHIVKTSSSVTLEWHYNENEPTLRAFITGYLVTVQKVGSDTVLLDMLNVTVADPRKKSVNIEGLQQNCEYVVSVRALTKKGPGLPASVIVRTITNYSAHLAKILTLILLLLGCTFLLWPQRKMLTNGLKGIFAYPAGMNINVSEFDTFLNKTSDIVLSHKAEECVCCDIEILNTSPPLNETTTLRDPEPVNTLPSPGSQSSAPSLAPSCVPIQADYCPQSAMLRCSQPPVQQVSCITNKSYLYYFVKDVYEPQQVTMSEIESRLELSDGLQESCIVEYGYISNNTLQE